MSSTLFYPSVSKRRRILIASLVRKFRSKKLMGGNGSKYSKSRLYCKDLRGLMEKTRLLQKEMSEMLWEKEKESKAYKRDAVVFAFKEAEWKQERKRLREEVKRLKKAVEEKENKIKGMEEDGGRRILVVGEKKINVEKEWELLGNSFLVEQMREERARRDETVEKWKQLYLAIKMELDHLIHRTTHGNGQHWRSAEKEEMMEELQAKEETIKALKAQLASMEHEQYNKEREIDILRQSLRIMSSKKMALRVTKNLP